MISEPQAEVEGADDGPARQPIRGGVAGHIASITSAAEEMFDDDCGAPPGFVEEGPPAASVRDHGSRPNSARSHRSLVDVHPDETAPSDPFAGANPSRYEQRAALTSGGRGLTCEELPGDPSLGRREQELTTCSSLVAHASDSLARLPDAGQLVPHDGADEAAPAHPEQGEESAGRQAGIRAMLPNVNVGLPRMTNAMVPHVPARLQQVPNAPSRDQVLDLARRGGSGLVTAGSAAGRSSMNLARSAQQQRAKVRGKSYRQMLVMALKKYLQLLARFPYIFLGLYLVSLIIFIGVRWRPVEVNATVDDLRRVSGTISMYQATYNDALTERRVVKDDADLHDRVTFTLEVYYNAKSGSVLDEAVLREIRSVETRLRALPGWQRMCSESDALAQFRCEPGESLSNYVWPQRLQDDLEGNGYFNLAFHGQAPERLPMSAALTYLMETSDENGQVLDKFLPEGWGPGDDSQSLRSIFSFTAPSLSAGDSFTENYEEFAITELYPTLEDIVRSSVYQPEGKTWDEPWPMRFFFHGDFVNEHELRLALQHDMKLAAGALVFTWVAGCLQFRSLFLGTSVLCFLVLGTLAAYACTDISPLGLATFLVVFLVFGLGGSVFFVVHDEWRRLRRDLSKRFPAEEALIRAHQQLLWPVLPIAFTSFAFLVHLDSAMMPVQEFGLHAFLGTGVLCFFSFWMFIPLLLIHENFVRPTIYRHLREDVARVLEPDHIQVNWKAVALKIVGVAQKVHVVMAVTAVIVLFALFFGILSAATRDHVSVPEVFPPDHQREAGRDVANVFSPAMPAAVQPPLNSTFCEPGYVPAGGGSSDCGLHWCEAPPATGDAINSTCACDRDAADASCGDYFNVSAVFVGALTSDLTDDERSRTLEQYLAELWPALAIYPPSALDVPGERLPSLVYEHWESGATHVEPFLQMPMVAMGPAGNSTYSGVEHPECVQRLICYCSERACSELEYTSTQEMHVITARRLSREGLPRPQSSLQGIAPKGLAAGRRLSQLPGSEIAIVFGIEPALSLDDVENWHFRPEFEPDSPWTQRAMFAMCNERPQDAEVLSCWILDFQQWLLQRGEKFPVQRFGDFGLRLDEFRAIYPQFSTAMWFDGENALRATSLYMKTPLPSSLSAQDVLEERERWMEYVQQKNDEALGGGGAWATANAWVDADAYEHALKSAWNVAGLALLCVALAGLAYTQDFRMTTIICSVATAATAVIAFFLFALFQWAVGPWEVIILTFFLGYALEPAYRLGHAVTSPAAAAEEPGARGGVQRLDEEPGVEEAGVPGPPPGGLGMLEDAGESPIGPRFLAPHAHDEGGVHPMDEEEGGHREQPPAVVGGGLDMSDSLPEEDELDRGALAVPGQVGAQDDAGQHDDADYIPDLDEFVSVGTPPEPDFWPADLDSREGRLARATYVVVTTIFTTSLKLIFCGFLLLPCEFRMFQRLGAVAVVVPIVCLPFTLVVLPAVIFLVYPEDTEPDARVIARKTYGYVKWLLS